MNHATYLCGDGRSKWGIWNTKKKQFQFGICEDTPMLAEARLFDKIGTDGHKWRFEVKKLPENMIREEVSIPVDKIKEVLCDANHLLAPYNLSLKEDQIKFQGYKDGRSAVCRLIARKLLKQNASESEQTLENSDMQ